MVIQSLSGQAGSGGLSDVGTTLRFCSAVVFVGVWHPRPGLGSSQGTHCQVDPRGGRFREKLSTEAFIPSPGLMRRTAASASCGVSREVFLLCGTLSLFKGPNLYFVCLALVTLVFLLGGWSAHRDTGFDSGVWHALLWFYSALVAMLHSEVSAILVCPNFFFMKISCAIQEKLCYCFF